MALDAQVESRGSSSETARAAVGDNDNFATQSVLIGIPDVHRTPLSLWQNLGGLRPFNHFGLVTVCWQASRRQYLFDEIGPKITQFRIVVDFSNTHAKRGLSIAQARRRRVTFAWLGRLAVDIVFVFSIVGRTELRPQGHGDLIHRVRCLAPIRAVDFGNSRGIQGIVVYFNHVHGLALRAVLGKVLKGLAKILRRLEDHAVMNALLELFRSLVCHGMNVFMLLGIRKEDFVLALLLLVALLR